MRPAASVAPRSVYGTPDRKQATPSVRLRELRGSVLKSVLSLAFVSFGRDCYHSIRNPNRIDRIPAC